MTTPTAYASVRYLVDDVPAAVRFYTENFGFQVHTDAGVAFARSMYSRAGTRNSFMNAPAGGSGRSRCRARR